MIFAFDFLTFFYVVTFFIGQAHELLVIVTYVTKKVARKWLVFWTDNTVSKEKKIFPGASLPKVPIGVITISPKP